MERCDEVSTLFVTKMLCHSEGAGFATEESLVLEDEIFRGAMYPPG